MMSTTCSQPVSDDFRVGFEDHCKVGALSF